MYTQYIIYFVIYIYTHNIDIYREREREREKESDTSNSIICFFLFERCQKALQTCSQIQEITLHLIETLRIII